MLRKDNYTLYTDYGLRLLRAHGMSEDCIEEVFRSTVMAKLHGVCMLVHSSLVHK